MLSLSTVKMIWVYPYFMERQVISVDPGLKMSDYRLSYQDHPQFGVESCEVKKQGSLVRLFTDISLDQLQLPSPDYYLCPECRVWRHRTNKHCDKCRTCPSKDGRTYVHCDDCRRCVKPTWSHCHDCGKCGLKDHKCCNDSQSTVIDANKNQVVGKRKRHDKKQKKQNHKFFKHKKSRK